MTASSYIRLRQRQPEHDDPNHVARITIASRKHCAHIETICIDCLQQWTWDWYAVPGGHAQGPEKALVLNQFPTRDNPAS